jgi:glycosyltransferase involved in cell wall biosynthesis
VVETFPEVSFIVTCRNNRETIGDCLSAISQQDYPRNAFEIIVIDACSTDGTVEIAKQHVAKVYSFPLNAPAAYNFAMKVVNYKILGYVDADARIEHEWLKKLVPLLNQKKVAGVSGAIETWNEDNLWARSIGYEIKNRYGRIADYTGRIATMNLLLKKSLIEEAGGWDETLPSQYDTDFGYRISRLGYKIAFEPSAKCYHFNRPNIRAYWRQQFQYGKNTARLYLKHGRLARGDEITDFGMNIQPGFLLAVIAAFLLGLIPQLRVLWYVSVVMLVAISIYFVISAARISSKFKDWSALSLVLLYYVRAFAWLVGGVVSAAKYLSGDRGTKRK